MFDNRWGDRLSTVSKFAASPAFENCGVKCECWIKIWTKQAKLKSKYYIFTKTFNKTLPSCQKRNTLCCIDSKQIVVLYITWNFQILLCKTFPNIPPFVVMSQNTFIGPSLSIFIQYSPFGRYFIFVRWRISKHEFPGKPLLPS